MNYSLEDIQNLTNGIYPKRCFGHMPPSKECLNDTNEWCGFCGYDGKEKCVLWRECNIFEEEKLAQDIITLSKHIDHIVLNLIYKGTDNAKM